MCNHNEMFSLVLHMHASRALRSENQCDRCTERGFFLQRDNRDDTNRKTKDFDYYKYFLAMWKKTMHFNALSKLTLIRGIFKFR